MTKSVDNDKGLESSASNEQSNSQLVADLNKSLRDNPRIVEENDSGISPDIQSVITLFREVASLQASQKLLDKEELVVAYRPSGYTRTDLRPIVDSDHVSASADSAVTELMGNLISYRLELIVDKLEKMGFTIPSELIFTTED